MHLELSIRFWYWIPWGWRGSLINSAIVEDRLGAPGDALTLIAGTDRCAALLAIWREARVDPSSVPGKAAMDPIVLAKAGLLPSVWLIECDETGSFFYRLIGEGVRRHFSVPVRGRHLHELYDGDMRDLIVARCQRVLVDGVIMFTSGAVYRDGRQVYYAKRILLPLSDSEGQRRYLIGTVDQSQVDDCPGLEGSLRFANDFVSFLPIDAL